MSRCAGAALLPDICRTSFVDVRLLAWLARAEPLALARHASLGRGVFLAEALPAETRHSVFRDRAAACRAHRIDHPLACNLTRLELGAAVLGVLLFESPLLLR